MRCVSLILAGTACLVAGCASLSTDRTPHGRIAHEAVIDCFESGALDHKGRLASCETSAAVAVGNEVVMASDKEIPGGSPVFALQIGEYRLRQESLRYLHSPIIEKASKYEGLTATPDGRYLIATTAFDRYRADKASWDTYNSLVFWPVAAPGDARVALQHLREGYVSSLDMRERLADFLGKDYFKVESIAALPDSRLLLGVRELGDSKKAFDYTMRILAVDYAINASGDLVIGDKITTVLDYRPDPALGLPAGVGLSGMEYDPQSGRIYLSTSFEKEHTLGGFLWYLDYAKLGSGQSPILLRSESGEPIRFQNKVEGLAVVGPGVLLAIHDDDREVDGHLNRKRHQAAYSVIVVEG